MLGMLITVWRVNSIDNVLKVVLVTDYTQGISCKLNKYYNSITKVRDFGKKQKAWLGICYWLRID